MTTQKFKLGDVVKLKSETLKMTVEQLRTSTGIDGIESFDGWYYCTWIDGEQKRGVFHQDTLELV